MLKLFPILLSEFPCIVKHPVSVPSLRGIVLVG